MISQELLSILCCPETRQPLTLASAEQVSALNSKIEAKALLNRKGEVVLEAVDGLLLREDGQFAYLIRQDIPIMLIEEAISL